MLKNILLYIFLLLGVILSSCEDDPVLAPQDGDSDDVSDWGFYASIFYGLDEITTVSARHGYVSELEELELEDRNRTSLALSRNLSDNVLARIQYDYNRSDSMDNEHAIWLQFKIAIGASLDCHANCNH